jgi:N-acetylglutamate synthase
VDFTTGGRLEVRLTAADQGKRVSVRLTTEPGSGPERFTDVVGVLTSWTDGVLSITRRTGEEVRIEESALVAGKVVPGAPPRRLGPTATTEELDRVAARGWPPVEREWVGEWELRAAGGFTRRANSVLALGDPGVPLDSALYAITDWYAERGLPAYIQLSTGREDTQEQLAKELSVRGWTEATSAEVRIADLAPIADADADTSRVQLSRQVDDVWLTRYQRVGRPAPEVLDVLCSVDSVWFATIPAPGDGPDDAASPPAAIGRCVVDGRWAGFAAIEVDPQQRRQGLATAVLAALARRALEEGASAAYLQAESANDGARGLYDRLGFATHHSYQHWRAPREDYY